MKCLECGAAMRSEHRTVPYDCGLPEIKLETMVRTCPECGAEETAIPQMELLHHAIATVILNKKGPLTGDEIRFLRKSLGWMTGQEFAKHAGVAPETVSRWETGKEPMAATADRFLRLAVAQWKPIIGYTLEALDAAGGVGRGKPKPVKARARIRRKQWQLQTA